MGVEILKRDQHMRRLRRMQRGVIAAARELEQAVIAESEGFGRAMYRAAMITLTYRPGVEWEPSHLFKLVQHYQKWCKRNGFVFRYVWTLEPTAAGVPHYHLVTWFPRGKRPPLPDKQGWWPHGMTNALFARSPVGYIAKYASKEKMDLFPKGARLWGYGGLKMTERAAIAFALAPRWLKGLCEISSHPRKKKIEINFCPPNQRDWVVKEPKRASITAWVLTAGVAAGFAFIGPYEYEGFTENGIALSHRGVIEVLHPDGDVFLIPHKGDR